MDIGSDRALLLKTHVLYVQFFWYNLFGYFMTGESTYKRVCYYTNWSQYRPGLGKYTPENIDAKLCTHIIYAFAKVENSELKTVEWNDEQM